MSTVGETQMLKGPSGQEGAGLRLWQRKDCLQRGSHSYTLASCHPAGTKPGVARSSRIQNRSWKCGFYVQSPGSPKLTTNVISIVLLFLTLSRSKKAQWPQIWRLCLQFPGLTALHTIFSSGAGHQRTPSGTCQSPARPPSRCRTQFPGRAAPEVLVLGAVEYRAPGHFSAQQP